MSGIYGVWHPFVAEREYETDIHKLQKWNLAYGNQSEQVSEDGVYMGCSCEKLHEKAFESSPVLKAEGKYAVIDALLYNRDEILEKGYFPDKLSDEELLFSYIEKYGFDALKSVNGDFAGAIYDTKENKMVLFRDHMGVRPLFYMNTGGSMAFSTDIRGLVSMQHTDVSVNEEWLWSKLTGTIHPGTESTEFANIFCVKPASYFSFTLKQQQISSNTETYWEPGQKKIRFSTEKAYIEKMRELITDSVKRRLDAVSGPVGAELSGGLDSSVIDILINRFGRDAIYFSWSASPEEVSFVEGDERLIVEDICRQEKINCHYRGKALHLDEDAVINRKMRAIGMEPNMDAGFVRRYAFPPYVNTLQICQTSQYVNECGGRVVFTGHGGDEGVSHRCNPYELYYNKEYLRYVQYMWNSTRGEKHRLYKTLARCKKNLMSTGKILKDSHVSIYAAEDMLHREYYDRFSSRKGVPSTFAYDPLSYVKNGGSRNRLDIVALIGAYCGVRYLVPYLDYRVIDYAVSIPRHMYLKNNKNRYIFREAFKDIMPESLYNLNGKEDRSWRNADGGKRDSQRYMERKKRLCSMLDRECWNKYLNWEALEKWANIPLEEADDMYDLSMFAGIDNCLSFQNTIMFAREI